jgi:hypothetical protein
MGGRFKFCKEGKGPVPLTRATPPAITIHSNYNCNIIQGLVQQIHIQPSATNKQRKQIHRKLRELKRNYVTIYQRNKWLWNTFLFEFLRFPHATQHSIVAPTSSTSTT